MFEQIDLKKHQLFAKSPLPKYTAKSLREKFFLDWIYNSNALEGNTLTINETKIVLEGITVGDKNHTNKKPRNNLIPWFKKITLAIF